MKAVLQRGQDENRKDHALFMGDGGQPGLGRPHYQSGAGTVTPSNGSYIGWVFAHSSAQITITSTRYEGGSGPSNALLGAGDWYYASGATSITVVSGTITAYEGR